MGSGARPEGVSVVVCCHNSADRLPETLRHLVAQDPPADLSCEVLIVDNASTDRTAQVARDTLGKQTRLQWKVVFEPQLGLTHARVKGIQESAYAFIAFVDDDNWVSTDWVRSAFGLMRARGDVGACGGASAGAFEHEPPEWFGAAKGRYAIGDHGPIARDLSGTGAVPWGAGLVIRHEAWAELVEAGFRPTLSDRKGTSLVGGGDIELCLALQAVGWRLWYDPRLKLQHQMPPARLEWGYFLRLLDAQGGSGLALDAYDPRFHDGRHPARLWLGRQWLFQVARTLVELLRVHPLGTITPTSLMPEGSCAADFVVTRRARMRALLSERSRYAERFETVRSWVKRARALRGER